MTNIVPPFIIGTIIAYILARSIPSLNPIETLTQDAKDLWQAIMANWKGTKQ